MLLEMSSIQWKYITSFVITRTGKEKLHFYNILFKKWNFKLNLASNIHTMPHCRGVFIISSRNRDWDLTSSELKNKHKKIILFRKMSIKTFWCVEISGEGSSFALQIECLYLLFRLQCFLRRFIVNLFAACMKLPLLCVIKKVAEQA